MKLNVLHAMDAMDYGGYIDFEREEYLYPKWWYERNDPEYDGMTAEECADICTKDAQASKRYLRVTVFNAIGSDLDTCLSIGITKEQLIKLGADKEEYWQIYQQPVTDHNKEFRGAVYTEEEWNLSEKIRDYLWDKELYNEFLHAKIKTTLKYTERWMNSHGITLVEEPTER